MSYYVQLRGARKTNRWPLRLFYFISDTACYSASVAFNLKIQLWWMVVVPDDLTKCRLFLSELGELVMHADREAANPNVGRRPAIAARAMLTFGVKSSEMGTWSAPADRKRGRCVWAAHETKKIKWQRATAFAVRFSAVARQQETTFFMCTQCNDAGSDIDWLKSKFGPYVTWLLVRPATA